MILNILMWYFGIALVYFLYCEAHDWILYFKNGRRADNKFPITHSGTHTLYLFMGLLWFPLMLLLLKCELEQRFKMVKLWLKK
ncbi:hypothetical protein VH12019_00037 [Vibrio phage VH1_2019]|uniref:Uncharacterized protein n=3 Tax=Schizotequatrovirus KVP40 TaxID=1914019 RepID=A0A6B9SX32_9CAUD|nr:hypothetical protein pp2_178 [Vibrio phage phi-pp2]QHJ74364.1 hypothetical protein VH12019_00037 [Vibrio phage VH1_2019]QIW91233.1 hypothetical protein COHAPHLL_00397 [Vibrio phage V09]